MTVTRDGKKIELTSTEYALLEYLMIHAGQVVTRTMISEHVWDQDFDSYSNVINVYVNYVRKKSRCRIFTETHPFGAGKRGM